MKITRVNAEGITQPCMLRAERTEEQKRMRHLYGDKAVGFAGKTLVPRTDNLSNTISCVTTDNLLIVPYET